MATNVTEIYVSSDNEEFTKLDLYKDESFVMKYSKKDLQDISKVFAPFSQNFTLPATPNNKQALGFFGNTEVLKNYSENSFKCKIYINGLLDEVGVLKLEGVKYKNNSPESITANFNTNLLSLKDRIGEDAFSSLEPTFVSWMPNNVYPSVFTQYNTNGIIWYTPLNSRERVWGYNDAIDTEDNIHFKPSSNANGTKLIKTSEIRPALMIKGLFDKIKAKYNLNINMPIENTTLFQRASLWANGEVFGGGVKKLILKKPYNSTTFNSSYSAGVNLSDSSINVVKGNLTFGIQYYLRFNNFLILDSKKTAKIKVLLIDKNTGEGIFGQEFEFSNGNMDADLRINYASPRTASSFSFFTFIECDSCVMWEGVNSTFRFFNTDTSSPQGVYSGNNSSFETGLHLVNLMDALPETKIIDFINSILKTFNISIYKSAKEEDLLDFLTPDDILDTSKEYAFKELDYTKYTGKKDYSKKALNNFNAYNFSHKQSEYKSNADFLRQFGKNYGQVIFPEVLPDKPKEYKIETAFTIVPPVTVNGTDIITVYGFDDSEPEGVNGLLRYTPNTKDLTLFYRQATALMPVCGIQNLNSSGVVINSPIAYYQPTTPFGNFGSFGFSILVFKNVSYTDTLYKRFYDEQTKKLLNINTMEHEFEIMLPASEMVISSDSSIQPNGFRLQNTIIIGETKYEILDASMDKTTGKTKVKLLNLQ